MDTEHAWNANGGPTAPDGQSTTPWRCENPNHAHTDDRRGATCRPDSLLHPTDEDDAA
ncbi:hypothetical protein ACFUC2_04780 [[Kitasatospora] papulosa]|uniref:hypothetical protein n=1 Tax=[Kitasatospora] papulosa TaxID=1464011 RepID=UPI00362CF14B